MGIETFFCWFWAFLLGGVGTAWLVWGFLGGEGSSYFLQ